jgi:hypothetical protein
MIKRIELQLFKDKKLIDIRDGYIERITKTKEQLEKYSENDWQNTLVMIGKNTGKNTKRIFRKESRQ